MIVLKIVEINIFIHLNKNVFMKYTSNRNNERVSTIAHRYMEFRSENFGLK